MAQNDESDWLVIFFPSELVSQRNKNTTGGCMLFLYLPWL